jgi:hypothetical protein
MNASWEKRQGRGEMEKGRRGDVTRIVKRRRSPPPLPVLPLPVLPLTVHRKFRSRGTKTASGGVEMLVTVTVARRMAVTVVLDNF